MANINLGGGRNSQKPLIRGGVRLPSYYDWGGIPGSFAPTADIIASFEYANLDTAAYTVDTLEGGVNSYNLTSTSSASDTLTSLLWAVTLESESTPTDSILARIAVRSAVATSTASPSDVLGVGVVDSFTDSASPDDVLTGLLNLYGAFTDTASPTETLSIPAFNAVILTDTASPTDVLTGKLTLISVLSDTANAIDILESTLSTAVTTKRVMVINAETGAVSEYTLTPTINGLGQLHGILYLACSDGLYAVDADDDDGTDVVWKLRTGFSNLGVDLLKRVNDVNVLGRTEGETIVEVVTNRYGEKAEYHYQMVSLTRDSYRDGVVKVGRGLHSVYWSFGVQGTGPAEVDELRTTIEPLSRRR